MDAVIRISGRFTTDMLERCVEIKPSPAYGDSSIGHKLLPLLEGAGLGFVFCESVIVWLALGGGIDDLGYMR